MSERGFFAVDRGVWDHPLFAKEKFSEREAWFWLISSAAWEPIRVRVGRAWFDLLRGQCAFALRFMAEKWMWSEPRVRRFLNRLSNDAAVLVAATREATLITICKYDDYQLSRRTDISSNDAPIDVKSTNPRRKEEGNKQIIKEDAAIAAPDLEADLFRRGKEVLGKTAGGLIRQLVTAKDGKVNLARAAIETAAGKENPREYIGGILRNQESASGEVSRYVDGRL